MSVKYNAQLSDVTRGMVIRVKGFRGVKRVTISAPTTKVDTPGVRLHRVGLTNMNSGRFQGFSVIDATTPVEIISRPEPEETKTSRGATDFGVLVDYKTKDGHSFRELVYASSPSEALALFQERRGGEYSSIENITW